MNVNTYNAKPLLDEVISGNPGPRNRVFREKGRSSWRWFEVVPNGFIPAVVGEGWPEVLHYWRESCQGDPDELTSFERLTEEIPDLADITAKNPRP